MTNDQSDKTFHPNRRDFLGVAAATSAASLAPGVLIGTGATTAAVAEASEPAPSQSVDASAKFPSPVPGYLSFGPDEAAFVEAMVNVMCPADQLHAERRGLRTGDLHRPSAVGRLRQGSPAIPARALANRASRTRLSVAADARAVLQGRDWPPPTRPANSGTAGRSTAQPRRQPFLGDLSSARYDERVARLVVQRTGVSALRASVLRRSDLRRQPDKVFWKVIGYPGLPATQHAEHGPVPRQAFPGRQIPSRSPTSVEGRDMKNLTHAPSSSSAAA